MTKQVGGPVITHHSFYLRSVLTKKKEKHLEKQTCIQPPSVHKSICYTMFLKDCFSFIILQKKILSFTQRISYLIVHHNCHGNHKEKQFKRATLHNLIQQMGREGGGGHLSTDKSESFYCQVKAVPYMGTFVNVLAQKP